MFKRNQIESAISRVIEPDTDVPSSALRTRIKRLLETDRALGRKENSNDPEIANYAFFRKEAPGSGVEIWFSGYEAFACLLGLQLMAHSWPQRFAVSVLRRTRSDLQKEHARILKTRPEKLFSGKQLLVPGAAVFHSKEPSFLSIASHHGVSAKEENAPYACSIHSNREEAYKWAMEIVKGVGGGTSMFELTFAAHSLASELARTIPHNRGRSG